MKNIPDKNCRENPNTHFFVQFFFLVGEIVPFMR